MSKYHFETKKKTRSWSFDRLTPGELRRKKVSEAAGYRKCRKCSFTLPMAEFRSTPDVSCKKCSALTAGAEVLKEYLAGFNLQKCCTCKSIKSEVDFYISSKTAKRRIVCKKCDKEHTRNWIKDNPQRFKDLSRNVAGRRRARIRNLYHKPITGEEYEILRAQRVKIFGE
nr:MAG TPA: Stc1 domain [Caudoviricetes sp.]